MIIGTAYVLNRTSRFHRLKQADAADLKQVVHLFPSPGKALDYA
jgi:hypothetical protein